MKTAIVTGASGNLGEAVTRKFLSEGVSVIGTVRQTDASTGTDPELDNRIVDLADEKAANEFVNAVVVKYRQIDAAVLTVGGFAAGGIKETTTADILDQYKLNFETAYNVARPVFLQMLKQNGGRLFLIGSRPGLNSSNGKGMVAYGLAKSLIFRLAELMNEEGKKHNVVTSVIVPSTIDTPQNRKAMPDADPANWVKAEEIADIIYYYCQDSAKTIREPLIKLYGNS